MSVRHEHLDEGMIHAWLDGALSPDESARLESQAATCEECGARVAEARGLVAASSRILASLDAVPGGVIPGTSSGGDQLAALRARRQAGSRRWWQDRRVVVAASLVLVAGVSRLAWQTTGGRVVETPSALVDAVDSTQPASVVNAPPTAPAPAPTASDAAARETRLAAPAEAKVAAERVAVATDSVAPQRAADVSLSRPTAVAANESRRADSSVVAGASRARADSTVVTPSPLPRLEVQQRQQALGGATRQAQLGFSRDTTVRPVAPPASFGERAKLSPAVPAGAGALRADAIAVSCFLLRLPSVVDTVRLLNQQVPVLSDPAWFRAIASGALRDTTLAWRLVDSLTVELRRQYGNDSSAVRFATNGAIPEARSLPRTRAVASSRTDCR